MQFLYISTILDATLWKLKLNEKNLDCLWQIDMFEEFNNYGVT